MSRLGPYLGWLFPVFWLGIAAALSLKSGWATLAKAFPSPRCVEGRRFNFASGALGNDGPPVSYGGCLFVTVGDVGIRLAVLFPLRLLSPPLFIPWRDVASVDVGVQQRFYTATTIRLRASSQFLRFSGEIGALVAKTWARVGHPSD
ncbi:MAG: hypothetical protein ABIR54_04485 [Burkholderiaceae bacterium]